MSKYGSKESGVLNLTFLELITICILYGFPTGIYARLISTQILICD